MFIFFFTIIIYIMVEIDDNIRKGFLWSGVSILVVSIIVAIFSYFRYNHFYAYVFLAFIAAIGATLIFLSLVLPPKIKIDFLII